MRTVSIVSRSKNTRHFPTEIGINPRGRSVILRLPNPSSLPGIAPLQRCGWFARLKPLKTERFFWGALLKGKELPVLEPLNNERFRVSFSETPSVWLHYGTRGHRNGLRGLEFGAEAKDSGEVKIISISCDRCWPASAGFSKLLQTWSANSAP